MLCALVVLPGALTRLYFHQFLQDRNKNKKKTTVVMAFFLGGGGVQTIVLENLGWNLVFSAAFDGQSFHWN